MDEYKLRLAMELLGGTPAEVAGTLAAAGVRGVREESEHCPVARWIELCGVSDPCVVEGEVSWRAAASVGYANIPDGVGDFIVQFDRGEHPALIDHDWRELTLCDCCGEKFAFDDGETCAACGLDLCPDCTPPDEHDCTAEAIDDD